MIVHLKKEGLDFKVFGTTGFLGLTGQSFRIPEQDLNQFFNETDTHQINNYFNGLGMYPPDIFTIIVRMKILEPPGNLSQLKY